MSLYVNIPVGSARLDNFAQATTLLGDADVTLQPFTNKFSLCVMPPSTMTADRTITFGNTSAPGAGVVWLFNIVRFDLTAFQLIIKKTDTTTIYTDPISPSAPRVIQIYCSNGTWAANAGWFVQT